MKPKCPRCDSTLRVKPQPRTKPMQMWQCVACVNSGIPPLECEWTNSGLKLADEEKRADHEIHL